jgi:hypothetical protein
MSISNNKMRSIEFLGIGDIVHSSVRIEIEHPIFAGNAVGWNDLSRVYGSDSPCNTDCPNDVHYHHCCTTKPSQLANTEDECNSPLCPTTKMLSSSIVMEHESNSRVETNSSRSISATITERPENEKCVGFWEVNSIPRFVETSDDESDTLSDAESSPTHTELNPLERRSKNVRFSTVQVREYSLTLGDHPLAGPYPLSLDWTYTKDDNILYNIDEFSIRMEYNCYYEKDEVACPYNIRKQLKSPRQLDVFERRFLLARMMGITSEQLDSLERDRKHCR